MSPSEPIARSNAGSDHKLLSRDRHERSVDHDLFFREPHVTVEHEIHAELLANGGEIAGGVFEAEGRYPAPST
jgi:hypothetical protein